MIVRGNILCFAMYQIILTIIHRIVSSRHPVKARWHHDIVLSAVYQRNGQILSLIYPFLHRSATNSTSIR
ncbi:hypothetical protein EYC84_007265 [Monilinia fructicola]|uniref:Uncharacterized protein n=1 Tax=Monilinia fructicola TaxID=38448 RepID=A0A5M9KAB7_MONFR|nr:hypothetical protein EYC84_007265 [Monilinia fructicola]